MELTNQFIDINHIGQWDYLQSFHSKTPKRALNRRLGENRSPKQRNIFKRKLLKGENVLRKNAEMFWEMPKISTVAIATQMRPERLTWFVSQGQFTGMKTQKVS